MPSEQRDDAALARAAAAGDRRALDDLLRRHAERIVAICRRVLLDPDDSRDAAQDALIAVARGIASFDGRAKVSTWIYRVATNAALDEARRRGRRPRPTETLPEMRSDTPALDSSVSDRVAIDAAMATLPVEFRAPVALRDIVGCDYAEIAEVLGIPPGTVRSRISRGRAALASALGNQDPTDEGQSS